jgi:hypothetical protein
MKRQKATWQQAENYIQKNAPKRPHFNTLNSAQSDQIQKA